MACSPTPTETQYTTLVSSSSSATFSDSVSTVPPVVATVTSFSCSPTVRPGNETGCVNVGVPVVTTIDVGRELTVQVPIITILGITQTVPTATLFATCSSQPSGDPPPLSAPSSSSAPASAPSQITIPSSISSSSSLFSSSSTSVNDNLVTPIHDPGVLLSSSSTGGVTLSSSVTTSMSTSTQTLPPSLTPSPTPSPSPTSQHAVSTSGTKGFIGPIVGGILGGFFGLFAIVGLIWLLWSKRRAMFALSRTPSPVPPEEPMAYRQRGPPAPVEPIEPKPYRYGAVGSVRSQGGSNPGTPRESSVYSHSVSPTTPRSFAGSASPRLSMSFSQGGAPTPPIVPATALTPGPSQPSSRPDTPGYFGQLPPSAFNIRQSWPLYNGSSDDSYDGSDPRSSPTFGLRGERRPSRLSLTLANWNPPAELEGRRRAVSSRTVSMNMSTPVEPVRTPPAVSEDMEERRQSALFVVNADTNASHHSIPPGAPT